VPPTDYKTTEKYVDYVDYLAKSGFIVLKIDLRGHGQSEGNPSGAYYSGDYIVDTLNARAALQTTPEANPSAIGLWGHSMAGNIVLRALAASPMIPAVVIWAGAGYTYQDLAELKVSDSSYRPLPADNEHTRGTQGLFAKWGRFDPNSDFWKTVVATNYLGDIKGAIQLNHAQNDVTVSIEYSRQLNKLLDATTIPHELYEYKIGGHNISGASFDLAMAKTVEFFTKYLK
jgi:dipeptidyl aminopeptidase/acylaminoacyl peptidase